MVIHKELKLKIMLAFRSELLQQMCDVNLCLYPQNSLSMMMMMMMMAAGNTEWMSHMHGSAQG